MPRTGKNDERTERIPPRNKKLTKIESLHQQTQTIDKNYNNLAKFPSENPYPVLRIHQDGTILYANKASEPLLKAKETAVGKPAPPEWQQLAKNVLTSGQVTKDEITFNERVFTFMVVPIAENDYVNFYGTDITEQRIAQEEREITIKLLSLINSMNQIHDLMKLVTSLLRDWSGCEAVGIRLQDGEDFPYFETNGFTDEFIKAESKLCSLNELGEPIRDSQGRILLECMCGNIISDRFDPSKPFFTEHGSFWSNCTTELLAGTTSADRMAKTRNRCNTAGYESVALVPLRTGKETFGLLQFNSKQKNKFTPEKIKLFERLADNFAIGLAQRKTEQALRESETRFRTLFEETIDGLLLADLKTKKFHTANPQICRMLGYSEEELKLLSVSDIHPAESLPRILELFAAQIKGDIQTATEIPVRRKDGTVFYADIDSKPFKMAGRQYMLGIFHDITEHKKMQEAILRGQKLSEELINSSIDGIHAYDHQCRYVIWNPAMERISGKKKDDVLGRCAFDIFPFLKETGSDKYLYDALAGKTVVAKNRPYKIPETGQQGFFDGHYAPLYDERNNIIGGLAVIHDVTEQKQAEEILRENEDKFRHVFDYSSIGKSITLLSGEIEANRALCEMLGYTKDELKAKKWQDVTHPDDIKDTQQAIDSILSGQKDSTQVFKRYIHKNGSIVWADVSTSLRRDNEGKPLYLMTSIVNITERKRAEEMLTLQKMFSAVVLENMDAGVVACNEKGELVLFNQVARDWHGLDTLNIPQTEWADHYSLYLEDGVTPMDVNTVPLARAFRGEKLHGVGMMIAAKGQPKRDILAHVGPIKGADGRILGAIGVMHDITEHKRAEKELLWKTAMLEAQVEANLDGLLVVDSNNKKVLVNKRLIDLWKLPQHIAEDNDDTLLLQHVMSQTKCPDQFLEKVKYLYSHHNETSRDEIEFKNGMVFDRYSSPVVDKNGKYFGRIWTFRDITEHKRAEETLRESNAKYRLIVDTANEGIWILDTSNKTTFVNDRMAGIIGFQDENMIGRLVEDFMFEEDWPDHLKKMENRRRGIAENYERRFRHKDGQTLWTLASGTPIFDDEHNFKGSFAMFTDITERKQAEEAIQKERNLLRTLIDHMPDGVYIKDKEGRILGYNKSLAESWGARGREDIIGKTDFDLFTPEVAQHYFDEEQKIMQTGQPIINKEAQCTDKSGNANYLLVTKVPLQDSTGNITGLVGIHRDITKLKLADTTLRQNEAILKESQHVAQLGHYILDAVSGKFTCSEAMDEIFGIDATYPKTIDGWLNILHPEQKEEMRDYLMVHVLKDGQPFDKDYRIIRQNDKAVRWLHGMGKLEMNATGQPVRMFGTIQDITERKRVEEEVRESQQLLKKTLSSLMDAVFIVDANTVEIIDCNPAASAIFGYAREEMVGKTTTFLHIDQTTLDEFRRYLSSAVEEKGFLFLADYQMRRKDGSIFPTEHSVIPVLDEKGKRTGWVSVVRDITERKQAEQKILEYQKRLKQLASRLTLVEEKERRRIAGELHDEVSQTLAMAKIKLDTLQNSPPSETSAAALDEISSYIKKVIQETRELTFELSNPILYELGFEAAVAEWLDETVQEKHGIATEFYDDELPKPLNDDLKVMLFRNTRELLTNCIKHAKAGKIIVGIHRIDDSIQVTVEDNGVGFDHVQIRATASKKGKFGLFSIRESMENTGGRFEIKSKPGAGCKAIMTAPLKDQNNKKEV